MIITIIINNNNNNNNNNSSNSTLFSKSARWVWHKSCLAKPACTEHCLWSSIQVVKAPVGCDVCPFYSLLNITSLKGLMLDASSTAAAWLNTVRVYTRGWTWMPCMFAGEQSKFAHGYAIPECKAGHIFTCTSPQQSSSVNVFIYLIVSLSGLYMVVTCLFIVWKIRELKQLPYQLAQTGALFFKLQVGQNLYAMLW